ncbi:MAG: GNAT family N-acetyltransferase [Lewinella sp.]|uniref:GNAT family N-acetyltransferase n=1 Tax=Lewinella sp. TaxID=2004506 RepID=UPI003D6A0775
MIRSATLSDLSALANLFDQYRVFYRKDSDIPAAEQFLKDRLTLGDSVIYVAEIAGELVGFTQLYPIFSSTRMRRLWLLNDLFVHPAQRGQGLSLQLLDQTKKHCRETRACGVMLETEKSNTIGNRLYPRAGFQQNEGSNFYEWTNNE